MYRGMCAGVVDYVSSGGTRNWYVLCRTNLWILSTVKLNNYWTFEDHVGRVFFVAFGARFLLIQQLGPIAQSSFL